MKKLYLILILILITGCSKTNFVEKPAETTEKPKPVIIGIEILEISVHNYIVGAKPEGVYLALDIDIANIGADTVEIKEDDIRLKDGEGNVYLVNKATSIYTRKGFPFEKIYSNDKVNGKLVFDVPDANKEFTLVIKNKSVTVSR
ncbi:DUF4352 domain-containing protein [Candidatus Woesearchaeota archaeon]|nr:DUF4352 domain-containing protein [Candidatus Woesearchaeota archaeon]